MTRHLKTVMTSMVLLLMLCPHAFASPVVISTGAGYKPMVEALVKAYKQKGGSIEEMYGGHIGQIFLQIEQGSGVNIVISDQNTLEDTARPGLFSTTENLGTTVLVLAWRKGLDLKSPLDLTLPEVKSVGQPDMKSAMYGRAATAFLESSGLGKEIADKLHIVSTVPQVFSYLSTGEMDAGFVNRVVILNGKDKLGGHLEISEGYPPMTMVAAVVKGQEKQTEVINFLSFLKSDEAKEIFKLYGVW